MPAFAATSDAALDWFTDGESALVYNKHDVESFAVAAFGFASDEADARSQCASPV
ncbi:MAG: hypothetical protein JNL98_23400 [Bryobacterales bacterium]|nr:hypothetical protein [Bryobacterales bacterium]